ncbi:transposase [Bifidobacterium pseudolongum subsp. globosum]|nr:transposase [Bifidobacterium pseudolongum subsp. globosum]
MSSRGGTFSAEEVSYLKTLPAVADVTRKRITYTEEFKLDCVRRYSQGESPVKIFRDAGLEPSLVGYKRIECAIARWRRTMGVPTTKVSKGVLLQCLFSRLISIFPQCGRMVFPGLVIMQSVM